MKLPRQQFLRAAMAAGVLPALTRIARGQGYPARPVRIVVGFAAGGTGDVMARLVGQWLSERLGQPFVIDSGPGAGGNLGTEAVVRAPADGHTLLQVGASHAVNATLFDNLNFDPLRDIAPVAGIARAHLVMLVHPSFPAATVPEFIAYGKSNRRKITMASAGSGSSPRLAGELFQMMTGIEMIHVPYRGGALALSDLIAGQVQVMFSNQPAGDYISTGRLRALAVTTATRSAELPDVPTVGEFVPGYEASAWYGIGAPKGTPAEIAGMLNREINAALADATIKARLADFGGAAIPGSPADFGRLLAEEIEKWGKVIRFAGIKSD